MSYAQWRGQNVINLGGCSPGVLWGGGGGGWKPAGKRRPENSLPDFHRENSVL